MLAAPSRLSARSRVLLEEPNNELLLSAASMWEIAIKIGLGKLEFPGPAESVIPKMLEDTDMALLPVLHTHALRVASLPNHHRDPFDRMLVAQAQLEGVPIMSVDSKLRSYDVEVLAG